MEFDGDVIKFNIFAAMRFLVDVNYVYALDEQSQDVYKLSHNDELLNVLTYGLNHLLFNSVLYYVDNDVINATGSLL